MYTLIYVMELVWRSGDNLWEFVFFLSTVWVPDIQLRLSGSLSHLVPCPTVLFETASHVAQVSLRHVMQMGWLFLSL